jgi:tetratricopeptide (TPR) repeat protein
MHEAAQQSLTEAQQVNDKANRLEDECNANGYVAWASHLRGDVEAASDYFQAAQALEIEQDANKQYLYSIRGIQHADHLRRTGDSDYARRVTVANLEICQRNGWIQCYRVLADLAADAGQHETAQEHYEKAITLAGRIDRVDVKIEAYLARGRWYAKQQNNPVAAFRDLDMALSLAAPNGYRIYEADIRIARAWAFKAKGDTNAAQSEAYIARGMRGDMGYHWGKVDAKAVLDALA